MWLTFSSGIIGKKRFWAKSSQGGHGRSREVTGANFCHLAAPRPPLEFLFWDHWETAALGQMLAGRSRAGTGGHGRLREVTGGYEREKRRKVKERQEKGRRKPKTMPEMSNVKCRV